MTTRSLASVEWLANEGRLDPRVRLVDFRWYLQGKNAKEEYARGHIPGAVFLEMEDVTAESGPGRHPIPDAEKFARAMRRAGVSSSTHVVVYDDTGGSIAARLWWLLRRYGHDEVSVLDGGLQAWTVAGHPLSSEGVAGPEGNFEARIVENVIPVDKAYVDRARLGGEALVLDARAAERYRGDSEPIDARPGHIPGAKNAPWPANLKEGHFADESALRAHYDRLGVRSAREIIVYCGSGVTACHNLLALDLLGLSAKTRLYEGSWSDWAKDATLPAAKGDT